MSKITLKEVAESTVPSPAAGTKTIFLDSADGVMKYKLSDGSVVPVAGATQHVINETLTYEDFNASSNFYFDVSIGELPAKSMIDFASIVILGDWLDDEISNLRCGIIVKDPNGDLSVDITYGSKDIPAIINSNMWFLLGPNSGVAGFLTANTMVFNQDEALDIVVRFSIDTTTSSFVARDSGSSQITEVTTVDDISGSLDAKYFTISSGGTDYYVWYDTGSSVDPAPGGTGIRVIIGANDTAETIAYLTAVELRAGLFTVTISQVDDKIRIREAGTTMLTVADAGDSGFTVDIKNVGGPALTIIGVNQSLLTFTVAGDKTPRFFAGAKFNVSGSTGNDGRYEVISSLFDTTNTIITVAAIPDATVDGEINTFKILSDLTSGSLKAIIKYSTYE